MKDVDTSVIRAESLATRRRVLFIAYLFPPISNSGTRRSLSFVNHLPDRGWEPVVLTVAPADGERLDPQLLAEVRSDTCIERVALGAVLKARRWASWLPSCLRERVAAGLSWRFQRRETVPDEVAGWLRPALARALVLHREQPFDVVYASGWPWTAFLLAQAIGASTGLPYVLDYRDNWNPIGPEGANAWDRQSADQQAASPNLERHAAAGAAALITVTQSLVEDMFASTGRRDMHLITNGFEPADFERIGEPPLDGLLRIVYTGVWRPGYGLHDLYKALARLRQAGDPVLARLRVEVAGFAPGPAREFGLESIVQELGSVSHAQALKLMRHADLQYLSVPSGYYASACLPGKLFEYLGSGRPILAVVPAQSEVARVLADVGGALRVDPGDDVEIAAVLSRLGAGQTATSPLRHDRLQRYTRASTTAQLATLLDHVMLSGSQA